MTQPTKVMEKLFPRILLPTFAALGAVVYPERADLVAVPAETIARFKYKKLSMQLLSSSGGRDLLRRRSRICEDSLVEARKCAAGTLGRAYATFMDDKLFRADDRPEVRFITDENQRYLAMRAREIHDILHVIFDCPTTLRGEICLKAIEFVQYGIPAHWAAAYFASTRLSHEERTFLENTVLPQAVRLGCQSPSLIGFDYEKLFEVSLVELRRAWKIQSISDSISHLCVDKEGVPSQASPFTT